MCRKQSCWKMQEPRLRFRRDICGGSGRGARFARLGLGLGKPQVMHPRGRHVERDAIAANLELP